MKHRINGVLIEQRVQLCAFGLLNAMIRPERLRKPVEFALRKGFRVVLTGETAVISRMPVLACNHRFTARFTPGDQRVCHINGTVAFRNRQRAARAKIILQIDQQQSSLFHQKLLIRLA
ncbi:hypothetical protein D3C78_1160160 [compost metagenome]